MSAGDDLECFTIPISAGLVSFADATQRRIAALDSFGRRLQGVPDLLYDFSLRHNAHRWRRSSARRYVRARGRSR